MHTALVFAGEFIAAYVALHLLAMMVDAAIRR
jgi:hypothetical protein